VKFASGRAARALLSFACLLLALPSVAQAYLDPGTGSYVVQLLIGSLLGGLFALGVFWRRVVTFVKGLFKHRSNGESSRR
jgi:hypothetical protein